MSAETIARALGGRRYGSGFLVRCPAHDDRNPSLSLRDGKRRLLVCCFAGCEARDVLAALRARGLLGKGGRR
jgi:putative DNA primase/helicase